MWIEAQINDMKIRAIRKSIMENDKRAFFYLVKRFTRMYPFFADLSVIEKDLHGSVEIPVDFHSLVNLAISDWTKPRNPSVMSLKLLMKYEDYRLRKADNEIC